MGWSFTLSFPNSFLGNWARWRRLLRVLIQISFGKKPTEEAVPRLMPHSHSRHFMESWNSEEYEGVEQRKISFVAVRSVDEQASIVFFPVFGQVVNGCNVSRTEHPFVIDICLEKTENLYNQQKQSLPF